MRLQGDRMTSKTVLLCFVLLVGLGVIGQELNSKPNLQTDPDQLSAADLEDQQPRTFGSTFVHAVTAPLQVQTVKRDELRQLLLRSTRAALSQPKEMSSVHQQWIALQVRLKSDPHNKKLLPYQKPLTNI